MSDGVRAGGNTEVLESGRGIFPLSVIIGVVTGGAAYFITRFLVDGAPAGPFAAATLQSLAIFAASWLLLAERRDFLRPLLPAAIIAAALAGPTAFLASIRAPQNAEIDPFPFLFWAIAAAPLTFFLLLSLSKSWLETGKTISYRAIFLNGLTFPIVAGGGALFAGLALILIFAAGAFLKQLDAEIMARVIEEPWFILPFFSVVGAMCLAFIRGQTGVLGAFRFAILLFARLAMPVLAIVSVAFLAAMAMNGPASIIQATSIFGRPAIGSLIAGLAAMLVFNGVYQNGAKPPAPWLRVATIITIFVLPVFPALTLFVLVNRISEFGFTPVRIYGLAVTGLTTIYAAGIWYALIGESRSTKDKWLPFVPGFNRAMALIWAISMIGLFLPFSNPWAISARNQEERLLNGKIDLHGFDFGYLQFKLGDAGKDALARLADSPTLTDRAAVTAAIARARHALTYWEYQHPELMAPHSEKRSVPPRPSEPSATTAEPGPMDLPLNPGSAERAPDGSE